MDHLRTSEFAIRGGQKIRTNFRNSLNLMIKIILSFTVIMYFYDSSVHTIRLICRNANT